MGDGHASPYRLAGRFATRRRARADSRHRRTFGKDDDGRIGAALVRLQAPISNRFRGLQMATQIPGIRRRHRQLKSFPAEKKIGRLTAVRCAGKCRLFMHLHEKR